MTILSEKAQRRAIGLLATEAKRLRGYEKNHRDKVAGFEADKAGMPEAMHSLIDSNIVSTVAKAETNRRGAEEIEQFLHDNVPGGVLLVAREVDESQTS